MVASNIGYPSKPFYVLAREFLVSQSGKWITVIHNCFDVPTPCCLLGSTPSVKSRFLPFMWACTSNWSKSVFLGVGIIYFSIGSKCLLLVVVRLAAVSKPLKTPNRYKSLLHCDVTFEAWNGFILLGSLLTLPICYGLILPRYWLYLSCLFLLPLGPYSGLAWN